MSAMSEMEYTKLLLAVKDDLGKDKVMTFNDLRKGVNNRMKYQNEKKGIYQYALYGTRRGRDGFAGYLECNRYRPGGR